MRDCKKYLETITNLIDTPVVFYLRVSSNSAPTTEQSDYPYIYGLIIVVKVDLPHFSECTELVYIE